MMSGKVEKVVKSTCGRERSDSKVISSVRVDNCPADVFVVTQQKEVVLLKLQKFVWAKEG